MHKAITKIVLILLLLLTVKKAEPGQFIILRADENGERIPLTIADYDREKGTITIIFQIVGGSTIQLNYLNEGDYIHDFVGPLGVPTHTEGLKKAADAAEAIGEGLQAFCLAGSVAEDRKVGLGHGNLAT